MTPRRVLLVPLDPVHDVGLKMIARRLSTEGHEVLLLPPDLPIEEIVNRASVFEPSVILVSRTISYGSGEMLARLVDMLDQAGIRQKARLAAGGMAMRPELAAELGFDAGFGPKTSVEEALAYVEGREVTTEPSGLAVSKPDLVGTHTYEWKNRRIEQLLRPLAEEAIAWAQARTSPGIRRADLRKAMLRESGDRSHLLNEYIGLCDPMVAATYLRREPVPRTRYIGEQEAADFHPAARARGKKPVILNKDKPTLFIQYGTGCPSMDIYHIKLAEACGAQGVVHFDPSWGARREGLIEGHVTHEEDGTIITKENLSRIGSARESHTLWQVRAHRGLNTPETVVQAAHSGADLTKINIAYGSLGAGTDPERLTVDGVYCLGLAAAQRMPYDVVTNEELCGVPARKAFASMLLVSYMGICLGGRPILQPLFCYSPEVMVGGQMEDNYIDFNAAKILALNSIVDAPVWPGAPVGFLTHEEDRVQSSVTTALHAALARSLGVDAVSIASSDEAYAGGPISGMARVDTLRATMEAFRFMGKATFSPTRRAEMWADEMVEGIEKTLIAASEYGSFVRCLYAGVFGDAHDGAYPGRAGRGTVTLR